MNSDIRISVSFKGHRKRMKLRKILGDRSDSYLIDLWITVSMDRPDGILTGWDESDIAVSCGWEKEPSEFVSALIQTGWLNKNENGCYSIHDWPDHQPWACNSKQRSETARKNIQKRWEAKRKAGDDTNSNTETIQPEYEQYTDGIQTVIPNGYGTDTPLPSSPILTLPIKEKDLLSDSPESDQKEKPVYPESFEKFWIAYPKKEGKGAAYKSYQKIKAPRPSLNKILDSIETHSKTEKWKNKQYIPLPATFLNQRRWEDEFTPEDFNQFQPSKFNNNLGQGPEYAEL